MLPCVWFSNRSQKTSKCGKNISDTLSYASCATFLFLPFLFLHFDVICDLLLNRRSATKWMVGPTVEIKSSVFSPFSLWRAFSKSSVIVTVSLDGRAKRRNKKLRFLSVCSLKSVLEKLRFRYGSFLDGRPNRRNKKLRFPISPAYCGHCLRVDPPCPSLYHARSQWSWIINPETDHL